MAPKNLAEWKRGGTYYIYKNRRVFYQKVEAGERETIVFIHGFPTASWDFHKIWAPLAKEYNLIAPDLLGFGYSDKPKRYHYSINDQTDLIIALIQSRSLSKVKIIAHDYGATIAQELMARANHGNLPFRIEKVVLLNAGLFPDAHRPTAVQKLLLSPLGGFLTRFMGSKQLGRSLKKVFGTETKPSHREINEFWSLIEEQEGNRLVHKLMHYVGDRKVHSDRWVEALKTRGIPKLFINGLADPVSGAHMADKYTEEVPQPNVVRLEGIGHYPQLEAPEKVLRAIAEFFQTKKVVQGFSSTRNIDS